MVSRTIGAGVLAAWSLIAADAFRRSGWEYIAVGHHLAAALALYSAVGALLGSLIACLIWVERQVVRARISRTQRRWARPLFYGTVAAFASLSTAISTFSGEHVSRTRAAVFGPLVFMACSGAAAAGGSALLLRAFSILELGRRDGKRRLDFWAFVALFGGLAAAVMWVDLTQYVALYFRVHTILELSAVLIVGAAYALILEAWLGRSIRGERRIRGFGLLAMGWLVVFVVTPPIRIRVDDWLQHVWLEEAYVGRLLRREQIAEAFFKAPLHFPGLFMSRIDRLRERFPLGAPSTAAEWQTPPAESAEASASLAALRGNRSGYNIIVYYVDTLRNDVARDASVMPNLARFAARSLDFRDAYATGSDTLRSLPAITGGNYDVSVTPDNDFLRVAARERYARTLVIAKSAREFIGKLRPDFHFDRVLDVEDYPAALQVWGYGAQETTAAGVVDRGLEFLTTRAAGAPPFLLWLFNFDQHNWHELDAKYVERTAAEHHIARDGTELGWRYRAVAAGIDAQFGRLLKELESRGALDDTVVLFVSDHGEALGKSGFWVHSVFLWDQLVRVPLVLHAPGLGARRIESRVSLVDIAPTLARYMRANAPNDGYQGEDLLVHLLPNPRPRRLPLLLTAASKNVLVRVGLVDPVRDFKLVLSLEGALPELYDVRSADPDAENLSRARPGLALDMLRQLYHSPVLPRTADDFDVRDTKQQKAQFAAEARASAQP